MEEVFSSGDKDRFKELKYNFSKAVREAKRVYSETRTPVLRRLWLLLERPQTDNQLQASSPLLQ